MGRYELAGFGPFQVTGEQGPVLTPFPSHSMQPPGLHGAYPAAGSLAASFFPATEVHQAHILPRQPEYRPWSPLDGFGVSLGGEERQHHSLKMDALLKFGTHTAAYSRLGNQHSSSASRTVPLCPHSNAAGQLTAAPHHPLCSPDGLAAGDFGAPQWAEGNSSPYRCNLVSSLRAQEPRDSSSSSSSPFSSYSGSPRGVDFRIKRFSSSTSGMSSPRTPTQAVCGHRFGIDPRLVVGSPLEIAWEVLQSNPGVAALLNLQPGTAKLRNLPVQEDEEPELPNNSGSGSSTPREQLDGPLCPDQLTHEQGLVRSCRGLPARVRDDLIKAARLAVTRRDSNGREQPGTGLLPFFWRVQANLKWLLQQPATLKGQLLPGQIDFITEEQRGVSFQKTVQQRLKLGELAVMLHEMLQCPMEAEAPASSPAS